MWSRVCKTHVSLWACCALVCPAHLLHDGLQLCDIVHSREEENRREELQLGDSFVPRFARVVVLWQRRQVAAAAIAGRYRMHARGRDPRTARRLPSNKRRCRWGPATAVLRHHHACGRPPGGAADIVHPCGHGQCGVSCAAGAVAGAAGAAGEGAADCTGRVESAPGAVGVRSGPRVRREGVELVAGRGRGGADRAHRGGCIHPVVRPPVVRRVIRNPVIRVVVAGGIDGRLEPGLAGGRSGAVAAPRHARHAHAVAILERSRSHQAHTVAVGAHGGCTVGRGAGSSSLGGPVAGGRLRVRVVGTGGEVAAAGLRQGRGGGGGVAPVGGGG